MATPRTFDETALLTTLPKEISISYEECDKGGWNAQLEGLPPTLSHGETEEEAESLVFQAFYELMVARRNLALTKVWDKALARSRAKGTSSVGKPSGAG
jgi:hypothetical protein